MNSLDDVKASIATLLSSLGISTHSISYKALSGGGNNRLFRIDTSRDRFLAKQYFRHPVDTRDRLATEQAFLVHAASSAPGWCPQLLAVDSDNGKALHEFIDGRPLSTNAIGVSDVKAALDFFRALNTQESRDRASLSNAADACFSIDDHLRTVDERVSSIANQLSADLISGAAATGRRLRDVWLRCRENCIKDAKIAGIVTTHALDVTQRCISPSDFGFHNALRGNDGQLRFLDFEYAGWDDPAKTVCDFFYQPAIPAPRTEFPQFAMAVSAMTGDSVLVKERIRILRPICAVKWCCIVLNVFLPVNLERRQFAAPMLDKTVVLTNQLDKAATQLDALESLIMHKETEWLMSI